MTFQPTRCVVDVRTGTLSRRHGPLREAPLRPRRDLCRTRPPFAALLRKRRPAGLCGRGPEAIGPRAGDMIFGVTRMLAGKVGGRVFSSRGGHIPRHGQTRPGDLLRRERVRPHAARVARGRDPQSSRSGPRAVCYVPPLLDPSLGETWGRDDLVMTFAYPADSGQDYGIIAALGRHAPEDRRRPRGRLGAPSTTRTTGRAPRPRSTASSRTAA